MKIDQLLIGLVMFSLFMVMGALIFNDIHTNYELDDDKTLFNGTTNKTDRNSIYNNIENISQTTEEMKNNTIGGTKITGITAVDQLFAGAYNTIKLIGNSFQLISQLIENIANEINAPPIFVTVIFVAVTLTIIFTIIALIFRFKV